AWRDADSRVLARAAGHGRGRVVQWTVPLRPEMLPALLDGDFPRRLRALLPAPGAAPARTDALAAAPLAGGPPPSPPPVPLETWLVAAALGLFAVERLLATSARRRDPA